MATRRRRLLWPLVVLLVEPTCSWSVKVAVAPATGPSAIAALAKLRAAGKLEQHGNGKLEVCAICSDGFEVEACRRELCGCNIVDGVASNMCSRYFPALQTSTSLGTPTALRDTLAGSTTLLVLADEVHPILCRTDDGETFASVPSFSCPDVEYWAERSVDLIDAAYEAGVQHVILHSSLGASGERLSPLQLGRMGGQAHVALRCRVEEHLKACVARSREDPTRPPMMHTILQAAPYADPLQVEARRQEQQLALAGGGFDLELPLTLPESFAQAAVHAALYTRPNTLRRRVTKKVISIGSASQ